MIKSNDMSIQRRSVQNCIRFCVCEELCKLHQIEKEYIIMSKKLRMNIC